MNTKLLFASIATVGLATSATAAHAQGLRVGGQLQLIPAGDLAISSGDDDDEGESVDIDTTVGFAGLIDYAFSPYFSIGAAPRYIIGIKGEDDEDSASQLDLAVRLTGRVPVAPKVELFAYASPGYSLIFPPENPIVDFGTPSGFILGLGAGAAFKVTPTLSVVGEFGYTWGFQKTTVEAGGVEVDADLDTDLLHIGVGLQAAL